MKLALSLIVVVLLAFGSDGVAWANSSVQTGVVTPTNASGDVYALVVGINDYYPFGAEGPDLLFPINDARDVMRALTDVYGVPHGKKYTDTSPSGKYGNIKLLLNADATKSAILSAIGSLGATANDDVIIFFSGHGTQSIGDADGDVEMMDNGFVVNGSSGRDVLWDGELKNALTSITANRIVVLGDFSWPSGFNDDLSQVANIMYIAGAKGEEFEDSTIQNGVFTEKFINLGIRSGYADDPAQNPHATPDGKVTLEEAYDYANHVIIPRVPGAKPNIVDKLSNDVFLKTIP